MYGGAKYPYRLNDLWRYSIKKQNDYCSEHQTVIYKHYYVIVFGGSDNIEGNNITNTLENILCPKLK